MPVETMANTDFWHSGLSQSAYADRKSTRLNSSHTEIYTLSLHDALPIFAIAFEWDSALIVSDARRDYGEHRFLAFGLITERLRRSEEHTSELQSHRDLHSFPTRRSSDLRNRV